MFLSPEEKDFVIKTIRSFLNKEEYQILLFGSFSTGKHHENSDIDIAIKGHQKLDPSLWAQIEEAFCESELRRKVDLVDYHRVTSDFQRVIDKDGILLS